VGGYLLPRSYLTGLKIDVETAFASQHFVGSYREAVQEVLEGRADLTSVFAPVEASAAPILAGLEEIWPGSSQKLNVVALTEVAPNDGIALSLSLNSQVADVLERAFLQLHESPTGQSILKDVFSADGFESAPRMSYRALYRVSLPAF
jgi:phosphonate transport system substrate-binding protein